MLSHGLSTGALFMLVGALQDRIGTRDLGRMGGLCARGSRLGAFGLVLTLALLGLPGMGNFVGELLVLFGAFRSSAAVAVVAGLGLVIAMAYALADVPARLPWRGQGGASFVDLSGSRRRLSASS